MGQTRIFSFPVFDAYARKQRWTDLTLVKAVQDVERGLNDGELGSNVVKRRIARKGAGSAAGFRVVVVIRVGDKAFLVEAFAKNVKAKHTPQETLALRELADRLLGMSEGALSAAVERGKLREIERRDATDED